MRRFLFVFFLLLLLILPTTSVYSCGGGANFYLNSINHMEDGEIIIHAAVLEVDDRGFNAILKVNRYFRGHGGEYLTVMRYPVALEQVHEIRGYYTGCIYGGGGQTWIAGSEGYFILTPMSDGTYMDDPSPYSGKPHFFVENGAVEFYDFSDSSNQAKSLPVDEFEALLIDYSDTHGTSPPSPNSYPLRRFLSITTESGSQYRLNPDRSLSLLTGDSAPLAVSEDGSHVVFRHDDDHLAFQYLSLRKLPEFTDEVGAPQFIEGQAAYFSPDSNFAVVRQREHLTVYIFDNYDSGYPTFMRIKKLAQHEVTWTGENPVIVWSDDSTTISFQDADSIWRWDIFETIEPELLIARDDVMLLDLSLSGRYVRYQTGETWQLLDTQTDNIYENAIVTPDERNLIYLLSRDEYPEVALDDEDNRICTLPLASSCPIYVIMSENFRFFWYKHHQIVVINCHEYDDEKPCYVSSQSWKLSIDDIGYSHRIDVIIPYVDAFDYDPVYDLAVIATNHYTLEFDFYEFWRRDDNPPELPELDILDLSAQLDSPIVALEWGQPIFYEHQP